MGERIAVCWIMRENSHLHTIKSIEAIIGAKPHKTNGILFDAIDVITGEAIIDGEMVEVEGE